jgi:hypothetical protein
MLDLEKVNPQNLIPRGKRAILHREIIDISRHGLALPQKSAESWKWTVIAVSPEVSYLNTGDQVWVNGQEGVHYAAIPGTRDLYIFDADCILVVVGNPQETTQELYLEKEELT